MKLIDQVAVVTGAGRNIGEATAKLLAKEGASIAVTDIDAARAGRVADEIRAAGGTAEVFLANVADEEGVISLVRSVTEHFGKVDILVNNVAISDNKHILDVTKEEWDRVIAVTLTGTFLMSKYFAQQMVAQGHGGNIVNVGSTSGFYGRPRAVAYTAAKAGVTNLSRSLAIQLAKHKIRVNCVVPNKIGSPVGKDTFDPTRPVVNLRDRPGVPDDLARAILFLVSPDSDFIDGTTLFVDGGVSALMPGSE
ncbi:SDR family NAD(P)-dependent oxidoreductase [Sinorhizobium mexicanum]|uniref:SDR family oxidoreductase n=2 Tax=Sinorhizobium TaxID=28105 RepID=A0A859QFS6_9HYPH|nr:SDR family NAD(P)-dependent oxidoreductase [Sinorhizobium mexicanum]MBP1883427.1 NAD(P)-dependent dehydrogenase (short-subunit alcohol dehydrogenase family) [Sinorhizobium mexicanum]QLL62624.1 SDR family oxidoreductase [Sinorhizobium mexicanum]